MVYTVAQNGTVVSNTAKDKYNKELTAWLQEFTNYVPTGGVGAHVWDYIYFIPDALFSQSSVTREGNWLYTINVSHGFHPNI